MTRNTSAFISHWFTQMMLDLTSCIFFPFSATCCPILTLKEYNSCYKQPALQQGYPCLFVKDRQILQLNRIFYPLLSLTENSVLEPAIRSLPSRCQDDNDPAILQYLSQAVAPTLAEAISISMFLQPLKPAMPEYFRISILTEMETKQLINCWALTNSSFFNFCLCG